MGQILTSRHLVFACANFGVQIIHRISFEGSAALHHVIQCHACCPYIHLHSNPRHTRLSRHGQPSHSRACVRVRVWHFHKRYEYTQRQLSASSDSAISRSQRRKEHRAALRRTKARTLGAADRAARLLVLLHRFSSRPQGNPSFTAKDTVELWFIHPAHIAMAACIPIIVCRHVHVCL